MLNQINKGIQQSDLRDVVFYVETDESKRYRILIDRELPATEEGFVEIGTILGNLASRRLKENKIGVFLTRESKLGVFTPIDHGICMQKISDTEYRFLWYVSKECLKLEYN